MDGTEVREIDSLASSLSLTFVDSTFTIYIHTYVYVYMCIYIMMRVCACTCVYLCVFTTQRQIYEKLRKMLKCSVCENR